LYLKFILQSVIHINLSKACLILTILLTTISSAVSAQENDSAAVPIIIRKHSPGKAAIYSAICPGLGQIYNKKYWKLPIIYGAGGTLAYFVAYNQLKYEKFRDAYANGIPNEPAYIDGGFYDYDILEKGRDFYRRYRDRSVLGFGVVYLLNIVDAMVDAHFFYFDVSDDLSLQLEPAMLNGPGLTSALGIGLNFRF
jgi:hypothetical protein